ncbi:hypothetical protein [Carboxylicivirga linearis]|uniref:Uncharacterized protein n=1 Tax=Carboxylicivirga linearis TaxID=1628157 RepID=A0ABS5JXK4_9BACT|nr:hypothetical protein [Carboxylicivirga linearis]MBS2099559.1 hypothetical protein [Carboxylicivirga linearis]
MTIMNLQQCKVCTKRKFSPSVGLICGLTMEKPNFQDRCDDGELDEAEAVRLEKLRSEAEEEEVSSGFFGAEKQGMKKGVLGGVVMITIAIVWFFGGLAAGYIFYYPPILFIIGLVAVVKGIMDGNLAGKKK